MRHTSRISTERCGGGRYKKHGFKMKSLRTKRNRETYLLARKKT